MKEVKDILVGVNEISLMFIERFKDGFQLGDIPAVWEKFHTDTEFHEKIFTAISSINNVKSDLETITLVDKVDLVNLQLSYIPKIIASFKQDGLQEMSDSIEELKNVIIVFNELVIFLISRFKDGFQIDDIAAIWLKLSEDIVFKDKLQSVFLSIGVIPTELKNLSIEQSVELSTIQLSFIPKIVEAIK